MEFFKNTNEANLKISISALRAENKRLRRLLKGGDVIKHTTWKAKYEKLFVDFMKLKNNVPTTSV